MGNTSVAAHEMTNVELVKFACQVTSGTTRTKTSYRQLLLAEHSPIRAHLWMIQLTGVPYYVSVHFCRHNVGIQHYVLAHKAKIKKLSKVVDMLEMYGGRESPVNHVMLLNAQSLINMAKARLCGKAHPVTQSWMLRIKQAIEPICPDLASVMTPKCGVWGGCREPEPCGRINKQEEK